MNTLPPSRAEYTNAERREQIKASIYFKRKMNAGAEMNPRYNHFMGALAIAANDNDAAKLHLQQTVASSPGDVLARSDYALHLHRMGQAYENDAREALRKALLIAPDHAMLHKNTGALLAQGGQLRQGLHHSERSLQLNEGDSMTHRNIAMIQSRLGDTHTALKHNLVSIQMETSDASATPHSRSFRQAAVQLITLGKDKETAHRLMDAARRLEGQKCVLHTSTGTAEVLALMFARRGDASIALEAERAKEQEKLKLMATLANEDVQSVLDRVLKRTGRKKV